MPHWHWTLADSKDVYGWLVAIAFQVFGALSHLSFKDLQRIFKVRVGEYGCMNHPCLHIYICSFAVEALFGIENVHDHLAHGHVTWRLTRLVAAIPHVTRRRGRRRARASRPRGRRRGARGGGPSAEGMHRRGLVQVGGRAAVPPLLGELQVLTALGQKGLKVLTCVGSKLSYKLYIQYIYIYAL